MQAQLATIQTRSAVMPASAKTCQSRPKNSCAIVKVFLREQTSCDVGFAPGLRARKARTSGPSSRTRQGAQGRGGARATRTRWARADRPAPRTLAKRSTSLPPAPASGRVRQIEQSASQQLLDAADTFDLRGITRARGTGLAPAIDSANRPAMVLSAQLNRNQTAHHEDRGVGVRSGIPLERHQYHLSAAFTSPPLHRYRAGRDWSSPACVVRPAHVIASHVAS